MIKRTVSTALLFLSNLFNYNRLCVCKFEPSCSRYAAGCVERHGLRRGLWKTFLRVLRCHPFRTFSFDPISE